MTSQQPSQSEITSPQSAVLFDCLQTIFRARRGKSAASTRASEQRKDGRDRNLVAANENAKKDAHQATKIEARRARRNHSSSSARKVSRDARAEAMVTIQIPPRISC